jgi:hypothetical protein
VLHGLYMAFSPWSNAGVKCEKCIGAICVSSLSLSLCDYFIFGLSTPIVPSHILVAVLLSLFGERRNIFDDVDDLFQTNCEAQEDQAEKSADQSHHRQ